MAGVAKNAKNNMAKMQKAQGAMGGANRQQQMAAMQKRFVLSIFFFDVEFAVLTLPQTAEYGRWQWARRHGSQQHDEDDGRWRRRRWHAGHAEGIVAFCEHLCIVY